MFGLVFYLIPWCIRWHNGIERDIRLSEFINDHYSTLQIRKEVSQLLSSLLTKLTALERYEDFLHRINTEAALGEPGASVSWMGSMYLSLKIFFESDHKIFIAYCLTIISRFSDVGSHHVPFSGNVGSAIDTHWAGKTVKNRSRRIRAGAIVHS